MSRIYISDLDGTILRNNAKLSSESREILEKLLQKNINITFATARSITSVKYILGDLPLNLPIIEHNGAYISDYKTGEHLIINDINKKISKDILDLTFKYNSSPLVSIFRGNKDKLCYKEIINDGMSMLLNNKKAEGDKRLTKMEDIYDILDFKIITFTIINRKEKIEDLYNLLIEKYDKYLEMTFDEDQYYPGWHWLVITSKKATKACAIENLIKMKGFNKIDITVFGDNYNDIPMFKIANNAIAVKNAKDDLKKYATKVIESNEHDSVVKYIWEKEIIDKNK